MLYYIILIAGFMCYVQPQMCPTKVIDHDPFNTQATFDILHKAITKPLTVTHKHTAPGREDEEYLYTINICGKNKSKAVTQFDERTKAKLTLGYIDDSSTLIGGENWLFLQYFHGDKYTANHHCDGIARQTWLSIRCEDGNEAPTLKVIEEARYDSGKRHPDTPCYYLFEYNHPAVCTEKKTSKLSGGAIFMIVISSLLGAYFLIGFLYQRFIKGAKGFEQIPNFWFWRQLGNTSADGCDFICRREERPNTYKGMADALDIDSDEEDDKDDGLLPM